MNERSPENLLTRLLPEADRVGPPTYLILRAEPTFIVLVFARGNSSPRYVFKAAREAAAVETLEQEHCVLSDLIARAPAGFGDTLPRPIARGEQSGLVGYLTSALPGTRMKDLPPGRIFGPSTAGPTLGRVTDWLADFYESAGTPGAVGREALFGEAVEKYMKWFQVTAEERALILESLEGLPEPGAGGLPICRGHGDFSPANVLWDDGRIGVIDFEFALEPSPPLDDLFHFLASMRSSTSARDRDAQRRAFFEEAFYGSGHLSRAARDAVRGLAEKMSVDSGLVEKLFVLAWVRYAVRSVELQMRALGLTGLADDPERLWQRLDAGHEEFLPVTRIGGGICGNVRQHLEMRDRFALVSR